MSVRLPFCVIASLATLWVSTDAVGLTFVRSIPPEGTWAEWNIDSTIDTPGVQKKVRLTSGPVIEKNGMKLQIVELSGVWEDDGKPFPMKARYEVDLDRIKKDGNVRAAARVLEAWLPGKNGPRKLSPSDFEMAFYRGLMTPQVSKVTIADSPVKLTEKQLSAYDLRLLKATANTSGFGEGDAPTSRFEAWIGDKVPFGTAKWRMTTNMEGQTIVITGTLVATGKAQPTTTRSTTTTTAPAQR